MTQNSINTSYPIDPGGGGTGIASYAIGDTLYASGSTTLSKLAAVATGNALISGGVATASSWGKIGLTTHVSGILPYANGGTNASTSWTQGSIIFAGASSFSQDNTNLFWNDSLGQFSVNTNSPISDTVYQVNGTKAFSIVSFGTQTSVSSITSAGAAVQSSFAALSALSPTNGSNLSTSFFAGTDIIIPSGKTATLVTSYSANPITNDNVGTVTSYAAFYFDGGNNAGTGTYTTAYGLLIKKPIFGSTKITAQIQGRTQIGTSQQFDVSDSGVVTSGTWNGTVIGGTYGGTGVNNGASTITLGGSLTTSGAFASTFTMTGTTNVTFPTSGTLSTTTGTVTNVSGTTNRITVATGTTTPVIDISASYVGQSSITTLGTITTGVWTGTNIALANGGTNASLTASNGGIFYSTGSAGAILSGTATALQMLQSGASTTPAWSTTTWPATTTINRLLWSSAANVISDLATGNNGVLITSSGGVPSISSTIPNATQDNITRLGTITSGTWTGTTIAVANGGTGTATGSITGTGALTFTSGGSNTNVSTVPNGTGVTALGGNVTMASSSKFSVTLASTTRTSVTGDSTGYVVVFDTATYNVGNNFDTTGFSLYTAPISGKYIFHVGIWFGSLGAGHTLGEIALYINSAAKNYGLRGNYANMRDSNNQFVSVGSWAVSLSANDTVGVRVQVNNSTKTVDIVNSSTSILTYFMGELIG